MRLFIRCHGIMYTDHILLSMAVDRMSSYDPDALISEEEMDKRLGITQEELDETEEAEFE